MKKQKSLVKSKEKSKIEFSCKMHDVRKQRETDIKIMALSFDF